MRSAILIVLSVAALGAATLAGCGGGQPAGARLATWTLPDAYLPPPDLAAYPRTEQTIVRDATRSRPGTSGVPTDAQVKADLQRAFGDQGGADVNRAAIGPDGLALIPDTAPPKLVALMQAANAVARKPYVYGGGHGRLQDEIWTDSAYDCSGSVSYALASAGYIDGPMVSGDLANWGKPGPGKWVTIFANAGHAFMVVAGLRFDTSGRQLRGTRWQAAGARSYAGFVVRHPAGL